MLFNSNDIAVWEATLAQYPDALQHHVANKKDDSLLVLDEWYQNTLPQMLADRTPMYIDSKELCQLMSWKLKRGKFRPSLAKLAASNADADVKRTSQDAFQLVPSSLKGAITKMAELKGVAILCAGAPSEVPFMADETMDSVPGLGTIAYTIPYYLKFATKVIEKAVELKDKGSITVHSPHLVEMALWTDYMLSKYNVPRVSPGSKATEKAAGKATAETTKISEKKRAAETSEGEAKEKKSPKKAKAATATPPSTRSLRKRA
ncbi:hypothetical protein BG011_000962 [Mortierella polycephala]|uniref:Uncharacterized protein n=1 Tax=Mortierella polycephala TaxID=41804 RepID=A0A9P6PLT6_9FUNG|nr:hypothetical protein BG011_000962 [Mortierella polycephala]